VKTCEPAAPVVVTLKSKPASQHDTGGLLGRLPSEPRVLFSRHLRRGPCSAWLRARQAFQHTATSLVLWQGRLAAGRTPAWAVRHALCLEF